MKKILYLLTLLLTTSSLVAQAQTLHIDQRDVRIKVGESVTLTCTYSGTKTLEWSSGNESVLRVKGNNTEATVTGVSVGSAYVMVQPRSSWGSDWDSSFDYIFVQVEGKLDKLPFRTTTISNHELAANTQWYNLIVNGKYTYVGSSNSVRLSNEAGYGDEYLWAFVGSLDEGVRLYNRSTGALRRLSSISLNGGSTLTMRPDSTAKADYSTFSVDYNGNGYSLTPKVNKEYYVSDYNSNGILAYTKGYAGYAAEIYFKEAQPLVMVDSLRLSKAELILAPGETFQLEYESWPANATDPTLEWTSSNTDVATVNNGFVTAISDGKATLTANTRDGSRLTALCQVTVASATVVDGSRLKEFVRTADGLLYAIPTGYITAQTLRDSCATIQLIGQKTLTLRRVCSISTTAPEDSPRFSSYKFNNKFNPQLYTDVIAEKAEADTIRLEAGCIGRWLTASFQLPDEETLVYVNRTRQYSKQTRQSFRKPVTYTLSRKGWLQLRIEEDKNGYSYDYVPYGTEQTVIVDFLSEHPRGTIGIPTLYLTTSTGGVPSTKSYYIDGTIEVNGAGVFPNLKTTPMHIKGRGNSSWSTSLTSKNPYHIKFDDKISLMGLTKGKHWVLLANKMKGSMETNAFGMHVADWAGTVAANHIIPCELYINDEYRGSYNLTEKVGLSNNSVDLDDESCATLLELDSYYNDDYKFRSEPYYSPVNIHKPDWDDPDTETTLTKEQIQIVYDQLEDGIMGGQFEDMVDIPYLARFLWTNEYIYNTELKHPKSCYLYRENIFDPASLWTYGPVWDLDWAFNYDGSGIYCTNANKDYWDAIYGGDSSGRAYRMWTALFENEQVQREYYQLWYDFMNRGGIEELEDFCNDYYKFVARSFDHNASDDNTTSSSYHDTTDYKAQTAKFRQYLRDRAEYLYATAKVYPVTPVDTCSLEHPNMAVSQGLTGDVNDDARIGVGDAVSLASRIGGLPYETCLASRADLNGDQTIDSADLEALMPLLMMQPESAEERRAATRNRARLAAAGASLSLTALEALPQSSLSVPITLTIEEGQYCGLQCDIVLPQVLTYCDIECDESLDGITFTAREISSEQNRSVVRLVAFGPATGALTAGPHTLTLHLLTGEADKLTHYITLNNASLATTMGEEERLASKSAAFRFGSTEGLISPQRVETPAAVYDLQGRRAQAPVRGVYIQGQTKTIR